MRRNLWKTQPTTVEPNPPPAAPWGSNAAEEVVEPPPQPEPTLPRPVDILRVAQSKTRQRDWEKKNAGTSYRGVPRAVMQDLKTTAQGLGVTQDDLARAFLSHSLRAWRQGQLQLHPQVQGGRWMIVEATTPGAVPATNVSGRSRQAKAKKNWQSVAKFRGLPVELQTSIREIAEALKVGVGAVATAFLRYALDDYQTGRLVLSLQPIPGRMTLE